jgi:cell division protein FtsL
MSNLAYSLPERQPGRGPQAPHIEIVSTRSQRRARPKLFYAAVGVAGLFVILIAQLLLSIVLSDGAYQISSLQAEQKELARDQQALSEQINVMQSPQNLAARAGSLGMVMNNSNRGWLRLSDGSILSAPGAATGGSAVGGDLIGNVLLTPELSTMPQQPAPEAATPGAAAAGAPTPATPGASVASPETVPQSTIPSPVTR